METSQYTVEGTGKFITLIKLLIFYMMFSALVKSLTESNL
jgi:hypothetical protein